MAHNHSFNNSCCNGAIKALAAEFEMNNQAGDAIWILTSAFIIFTMQSGFGLLEAGTFTNSIFIFGYNVYH